jgi:hypothetical protein
VTAGSSPAWAWDIGPDPEWISGSGEKRIRSDPPERVTPTRMWASRDGHGDQGRTSPDTATTQPDAGELEHSDTA